MLLLLPCRPVPLRQQRLTGRRLRGKLLLLREGGGASARWKWRLESADKER